jgi:hypothetical protein
VDALVTLGDKYNFEHLLKEGIGQMEQTFPSHFTLFASNRFPKSGFEMDIASSLPEVVNLAKKFRIESCLPGLYYFILIQKGFPVR